MSPLEKLIEELKIVGNIHGAISVLHWDQETYMPPGSGPARAEQIAFLESMAHERLVGDKIKGPLSELVDLDTGKPKNGLSGDDQHLAHEIWKDYHKAAALPKEFVEDLARLTSQAQQVWVKARKTNDYGHFAPILKKVVDLKYREIDYLGEKDTPYDTLMDYFEPGMTSAGVTRLFDEMKARLVPLVQRVVESKVDTHPEILTQDWDEDKQWEFGLSVLRDMGYNFDYGRQDQSAHPFTINFHPTDVRITTRVKKNDLMCCFSSTVHEGGHGLYEQGLDPEWFGTPYGKPISYGIHESQSRLWENLIALSLPFWSHYYPKLQKVFPENLSKVSLEDFYRAINTIKPSLIRTEADEMTYNLHIMLRFEIEKAVINEHFPIEKLPELWDDKMEECLGIRPDSDANGVLQDVHWSFGGFGYFPTYALGNLYNVPMLKSARKQIPDFDHKIESGNLLEFREWLKDNIHQIGRRKTAAELIKDLSGEPLTAKPFLDYLEEKYTSIYEL